MKNDDRGDVVRKFIRFQETGQGFGDVWNALEPAVRDLVSRNLVKRGGGRRGGVDPWAADDVVSSITAKLLKLGRPGSKGRFDPARVRGGLSGFWFWLRRVIDSQVVSDWRGRVGGGAVKCWTEGRLPLNELSDGEEPSSAIDRAPARIQRPDLLPVLERAIARLPANLALLVRLRLEEDLSQRQIAARLGSNATAVCRQLSKAYALVGRWLEDEGFDEAWLPQEPRGCAPSPGTRGETQGREQIAPSGGSGRRSAASCTPPSR